MSALLPGRPSTQDTARLDLLRQSLEDGNTRAAAAAIAGIGRQTFYDWCRDYPYVADMVARAEAIAEEKALAAVRAAYVGDRQDWRAGAWWLERRRRAEYGPSLNLSALPVEKLRELVDDGNSAGGNEAWPSLQQIEAAPEPSDAAQTTVPRDTYIVAAEVEQEQNG